MEMTPNLYTRSEFARLIHVSVHTLLNWETNKKLIPKYTYQNGQKYYDQEQLDQFLGDSSNGETATNSDNND